VRRIPDTVRETAAAFTLAALTAVRMVVTRAKVDANDDVLIWGIGGGVALAALQLVKQIGARAWVTSSSDEKLERAASSVPMKRSTHASSGWKGDSRPHRKAWSDVSCSTTSAATPGSNP
jgi:NADPH:quinone reductase-like Zn-dependent oxidoreductase